MPEFLTLRPPDASLELLLDSFVTPQRFETIASLDALDRVLAEPIRSNENLPAFPRSTVDGFAVRARDTFGASENLPAYLNLIGEVSMGESADISLKENSCALIHTGGMIPANADAVVMVENTQQTGKEEIEILKAVAPGENVIEVGEDVEVGSQVIPAGVRVR
nr:molybdopterin molybdenumtransferase MoeA [candidate division Zixibacteria bacterium]NIW46292.1 molybdopterin molybdenumtransferase MoeA [Gammaproteobacteria bacterium]NIR65226.1 molybdopterin molybdenumtransferase MoeA [candidate division Zixibacteria bacterium]NIS46962.1 molybdopterin molybdenumtransferase MoeA [candidate division Zixibacteria bacterium]NIU15114.1 molybdopterin molybdenumtransferase MoeA [candidate division Zixibacteria bacterium]